MRIDRGGRGLLLVLLCMLAEVFFAARAQPQSGQGSAGSPSPPARTQAHSGQGGGPPLAAAHQPGPVGQPSGQWREQIYWVPLSVNGEQRPLYTRICRPQNEAPARAVVIAHGQAVEASARLHQTPLACDSETALWFLNRGFVVVAPIRRGYGATGGRLDEVPPPCDQGQRDYAKNGLAIATDLAAAIDYIATLPFVQPTGMVLIGQSAGGLGAIAYNSLPHPRVSAIVNFAGGNGGHMNEKPNDNCQPERLAVAAGVLARGATTPMLWIYAQNDTFFNPAIAAAMYAAYTQNGGKAEFDQPEPFGSDGHGLFFGHGGSAIWGPLVEHYLATRPTQ
jgi:dienelactone hydrolase